MHEYIFIYSNVCIFVHQVRASGNFNKKQISVLTTQLPAQEFLRTAQVEPNALISNKIMYNL